MNLFWYLCPLSTHQMTSSILQFEQPVRTPMNATQQTPFTETPRAESTSMLTDNASNNAPTKNQATETMPFYVSSTAAPSTLQTIPEYGQAMSAPDQHIMHPYKPINIGPAVQILPSHNIFLSGSTIGGPSAQPGPLYEAPLPLPAAQTTSMYDTPNAVNKGHTTHVQSIVTEFPKATQQTAHLNETAIASTKGRYLHEMTTPQTHQHGPLTPVLQARHPAI